MLKKLVALQPYTLSLLRIAAGINFWAFGLQKILGSFGGLDGHGATASFPSLFWTAGALEIAGGPLMILGLFTSPVAFLLSGEMAVAYFMQHASRGLWPHANGGELAVLYCFIYLFLATAGGGAWSLDRLFFGSRSETGLKR